MNEQESGRGLIEAYLPQGYERVVQAQRDYLAKRPLMIAVFGRKFIGPFGIPLFFEDEWKELERCRTEGGAEDEQVEELADMMVWLVMDDIFGEQAMEAHYPLIKECWKIWEQQACRIGVEPEMMSKEVVELLKEKVEPNFDPRAFSLIWEGELVESVPASFDPSIFELMWEPEAVEMEKRYEVNIRKLRQIRRGMGVRIMSQEDNARLIIENGWVKGIKDVEVVEEVEIGRGGILMRLLGLQLQSMGFGA